MICLSKNLADEYINKFAKGSNLDLQDYNYSYKDKPILINGMGKRKLIKKLWDNNHTFYYMDSGYVGNYKSTQNPMGWKHWHRIVKNNVQHLTIEDRPEDRWIKLNYPIEKRKTGSFILLVTPSDKPCRFYGIDRDKWIDDSIKEIKKYTDREIVIRNKTGRKIRVRHNTIFNDLKNCHALVTYQSIAAVESILFGVPAFTLAPCAANPVANTEIKNIEHPYFPSENKRYKWAFSLAYGQFHNVELENGHAYKILMETT